MAMAFAQKERARADGRGVGDRGQPGRSFPLERLDRVEQEKQAQAQPVRVPIVRTANVPDVTRSGVSRKPTATSAGPSVSQQDQGDEQIEARARAQLGQLDARDLPGAREQSGPGRGHAQRGQGNGPGLGDVDILGSLQGRERGPSGARSRRGASRRNETGSAPRPETRGATKTTRLIRKPRSSGIGSLL